MTPLLKWAGGKARLAEQIAAAFGEPCAGAYYEPFLGAGAVFLYLKARNLVGRAVLSDANPKLVAVHRAVRDDVEAVLTALAGLPRDDWEKQYYHVRDAYNRGPFEGPVHAARLLWLNRAGFNGLYRENASGEFNVPVGRYAEVSLPAPERFRDVSALLQGAEIEAAPYADVMVRAGSGDHVYCDPPYVPLTKTADFTAYCGPFGQDEQLGLANAARSAALAGARVVLSNHDLPFVRRELYPLRRGFQHFAKVDVHRSISRGPRGAVPELIATIGPLDTAA